MEYTFGIGFRYWNFFGGWILGFGFFPNASVPQQLQGEFRKLVFVGASPTGGPFQNAERRAQNEEREVDHALVFHSGFRAPTLHLRRFRSSITRARRFERRRCR
jgi:hypothetical protein